jgi:hypothetical protein
MKGSRLAATIIIAIIAGLSLSTLTSSTESDRGGVKGEITAVSAFVAKHFQEGDSVRVTPFWNEDLWVDLKNIGPGTEKFPFPALLRGDRIDVVTLLRMKRIWMIGSQGRKAKPSDPLFETLEPSLTEEFADGTTVALYDMPDMGHKGSLSSSLNTLSVARAVPGREERPCPKRGRRHRCGKEGWENPSVETRDVFHNEVSWLLAHPPANNETLVITWPTTNAAYLIVRAGFTLKAVRKEQGSPVTVKVSVNGVDVDTFTLEPHKYHLEMRLLPLDPEQTKNTVRFEVHAEDHRFRQLMLEADIVSNVPDVVRTSATYSGI